jgi:hypothetical protein
MQNLSEVMRVQDWIDYCGTLKDFVAKNGNNEYRDEFQGLADYAAYCDEWC